MFIVPTTPSSRLIIVLGDQLWMDNPALVAGDRAKDIVLMVECTGEATHVRSHKARIALFFSAMRHFAADLKRLGWNVQYLQIGKHAHIQIADAVRETINSVKPTSVLVCEPGDWRLEQTLREAAKALATPLDILVDTSFLLTRSDFANWAKQQPAVRIENFYRFMRTRTGILMNNGMPVGGDWHNNNDNQQRFPAGGPGFVPLPVTLSYDELTWHTLRDVRTHFPDHPGDLEEFPWAVTRKQALMVLEDFVSNRLPLFSTYQDGMWAKEPVLYHSLLASSLNLRLLDPREVIRAAERAYRNEQISLSAAEGFIRQILGWREFIHGMYWLDMPSMAKANYFGHTLQLPRWFWTGETDMHCMRQTLQQTMQNGYANDNQRLMIIGNFALLAGLNPELVSDWFLAVYVDAVEWAALPNVTKALFSNGARFSSNPNIAPGAYVRRVSNYCDGCRYSPNVSTGPEACPFTTFFWSFLDRNEAQLQANPRTISMVKNLQRLSKEDRAAIRHDAIRKLGRLDKL